MERGFTSGSDGKDSSAVKETLVQSLGWEDPLEKETAPVLDLENSMNCVVHGVTKSCS